MNLFIQRLSTNPHYAKALDWGKLLTITSGAQILIQGIGLISSIIVIRLLPAHEYALYTLANTMLGTITVLADGGISAGVMAQGGKYWQDREKLGAVLVTGLDLRKKFAIYSLLVASPALLYLLLHHNAGWIMAVVLVLSIMPAFFMGLSGVLFEIAPKLHQDIGPLQKNQVGVNAGRLALISLLLFSFPWAFLAILAAGIPQVWANKNLRKISTKYANWMQRPDPHVRQDILVFVKRIMPGAIYYCLSGQVTLWLISIFGSTTEVAQIGALGRLGMLLGLFSMLFATLILPRYARLPNNAALLLSRYLLIQAGFILLSTCIVSLVWKFPLEALWILGKEYKSLTTEVVLSVANACLGLLVGASFSTCTSRGWVIHPLLSIPIAIGAIICGVTLLDIRSLQGILLLNMFVALVEFGIYFSYNLLKINQLRNIQ